MLRTVSKYLGSGVIIALLLLRFSGLENDPPLFYVGYSQAPITDAYQSSFFARNAVLFDDWNPFDFHRWDNFKNSIISGVSLMFFSTFGVSRETANLAAIFLQIGGLFFFLLGLLGSRDYKEVALTALLLLLNSTLFFYGRLPFLENGLIFISGLTFYIFVTFHNQAWGQVVTGGLVALAALSGKLFGYLLLGPVLLTLVYEYRSRATIPILFTLGGLILGTAVYLFTFYGGNLSTLMNYYSEQTVGMYGAPPGFTSLANFFKMLLTHGGESGLWRFVPFLFVSSVLSLVVLILTVPYSDRSRQEYLPIIFCVGWLLGGILGLIPFYYRPMRYGLFLFLPIAAICAYTMRLAFTERIKLQLHSKWISLTLIFFACWYAFTQFQIFISRSGRQFQSGVEAMPETAIIALVVTGLVFLLLRRYRRISPRRVLMVPLGLLLLAAVILQGSYLFKGLSQSGKVLKLCNVELSQIVDRRAVVAGPYTPALTIDNELHGAIYMFGLTSVEKNIFERIPITHISTDGSNWKSALRDFPFLKSATKIVQMIVRDNAIDLYRLPNANIPATDFELGSIFLAEKQYDSALVYFRHFTEQNPQSFFGKTHLALALFAAQRIPEAVTILDSLIEKHPNNYMLHGFCQGMYLRFYSVTREEKYRLLARHHGKRAHELNPDMPKAQ